MENSYCTPQALFNGVKSRAILGALIGDNTYIHALRIGEFIWDVLPGLFPEYAETVVTSGPQSAMWDIMMIARDTPGAWDIYVAARNGLKGI